MANRYGDEDDPRPWRGDARSWHERYERPGAGAVGFGRESWGDEPRRFGRSRGEEPRREPRGGWDLHQGLHRSEWGRPEEFRVPGKPPKGYTRADERIREDICDRLMLSPYDSSEVEITVAGGEVTLTGTVHSRADKWGIEDVAEAALGAQTVHNQIRVNRGDGDAPGTILAGDTGYLHS